MNNYDYENGGVKTIYACIDKCNVSIEIITTSEGLDKFAVVNGDKEYLLTVSDMINEVNRGRSNDWTPYNHRDFMTGWWEFVEEETIYLNKMRYETL